MKKFHKTIAGFVLAATLTSSMAVTAPAQASTEGRKNTALALGAVALQQLLTGKTTNGLIAGAATALAYKSYKDEKDDEDRSNRWKRFNHDTRNNGHRNDRFHHGSNRR